MKYSVLVGRIVFAAIFLVFAPGHFGKEMIETVGDYDVPMPNILVPQKPAMAQ